MRFPTDVKLLWECVDRAYKMMCGISSQPVSYTHLPITAVNGEEVIKSNGHLTDLDGNDIADEHAKDYYCLLYTSR